MKILYKHWHQPITSLDSNHIKEKVESLIEDKVNIALSGLNLISKKDSKHLLEYAKLILNRKF